MTRIREIKTTFTAGEVSRELLGRGDLLSSRCHQVKLAMLAAEEKSALSKEFLECRTQPRSALMLGED